MSWFGQSLQEIEMQSMRDRLIKLEGEMKVLRSGQRLHRYSPDYKLSCQNNIITTEGWHKWFELSDVANALLNHLGLDVETNEVVQPNVRLIKRGKA